MNARRRFVALAVLAVLISGAVGSVAIFSLYRVGLAREREALAEVLRTQASLTERSFLYELDAARGDTLAGVAGTLSNLRAAQKDFVGFGRTGEIMVTRRVGDTLVFELGQRGDQTRVPAPVPLPADSAIPSQRAAAGQSGTMVSLDYRGVRVLAAYAPVPVTGLGMVAKMDLEEVRAPYLRAALLSAGVAGVLILVALTLGLTVGAPLLAEVEERESAHRAVLEHFPGVAFRVVPDDAGRWRFDVFEGAAEALTGWPREHFLEDPDAWPSLMLDKGRAAFEGRSAAYREGTVERSTTEYPIRRKDGSVVWVRTAARTERTVGGVPVVYGVHQDVTELRAKEDSVRRAERALSVRRRLDSCLLAATSEGQVWQAACEAMVEGAGYRMAWIGIPEDDAARTVRPEASMGAGVEYLSQIRVSWGEEDPRGRGPTGRAVRTGTAQVARDIESDATMSPWRAAAREHGFRSSAALPIAGPQGLMSVLNAYAPEADAFDGDELALLQELADDVGRRVSFLRVAGERSVIEGRFEAFMEASPAAAWIKDAEGRHLYANRAWEEASALEREGWYGRTEYELSPQEAAEWRALDQEVLETGRAVSRVMSQSARGERRVWQTVKFPLAGASGEPLVAALATEITGLVEVQEALRESEERLRLAVRAGGHGLYDLDLRTGDARVNEEYSRMLGHDPATFVETNAAWRDRLHPDDRDRVYGTYEAYVRGELPTYQVEFRQRTAEGGWKWTLSLGEIVEWDEEGRPVRMMGTHTDLQAAKEAEEALRESEDRFRRAVETAPDAIAITTQGSFAYVNQAVLELLGAESPDQLVGHPVLERIVVEDREEMAERIRLLNEEQQPIRQPVQAMLRLDGTAILVELMAVPFTFHGQRGALSFARDVTGRIRAEAEIRAHLDELQRWQAVMLDREDRVQELKREVNGFCRRAGVPARYPSQEGGSP